ncbi:hypothetical protein [Halolamina sediminis]|jgi:hypothetical protein|uniref:hypothetical protein n=1 Tax=Halolamina sediminis TaxID=1480675 RepID=UPI0006B66203|nr:hypothetical protein [Halolamina sediminis]
MSGADSSTGLLSGNRELLITAGVSVLALVLLLGVFGFGGVVGIFGFVVYTAVWLALAAFVLWLFYRLVVAVERIAHAQQRIAAAKNPPSGSQVTAENGTDGDDTGETDIDGTDADGDAVDESDADGNDAA